MKNMLILPIALRNAEKWWQFALTDIDVINDIALNESSVAGLILSLNDKTELRPLLRECGKMIVEHDVKVFIWRTDNPTVEKWCQKWQAAKNQIPGHRARYVVNSLKFQALAIRAFLDVETRVQIHNAIKRQMASMVARQWDSPATALQG
jgi:hypothetical protein